MKYQNLLFGALSLLLASSSGHAIQTVPIGKSTVEVDDKPVVCSGLSEETNRMKKRRPLDTGVLREAPIDIIPKELFMERLEASPLWDKGQYTNHYKRSFDLEQFNAWFSFSGIIGLEPEQIHRIHYRNLDVRKRNQDGHQLLAHEKFAMTEIINLVIDDRAKAEEILEQLYTKYLVKVQNNETLSDHETYHAYVRYQGILFEMWGITRANHPIEECNYEMLTALVIN